MLKMPMEGSNAAEMQQQTEGACRERRGVGSGAKAYAPARLHSGTK